MSVTRTEFSSRAKTSGAEGNRGKSGNPVSTLLFVMNFKANTGFAWTRIEKGYAQIADHLVRHRVRTLAAYPEPLEPPATLEGSAAEALAFDVSLEGIRAVREFARVIRREQVKVLYLVDRPTCSWKYLVLRLAGVRQLLVHDHTSGARTRPTGVKRFAKSLLARLPWINADRVVAVSRYVEQRQLDVAMTPAQRVTTVLNGVALPAADRAQSTDTNVGRKYGIPPGRPLVLCACRATPEKGVEHLLRAFDLMLERHPFSETDRPILLYAGDGPQLEQLQRLRASLSAAPDIVLAGYSSQVAALLREAVICAIPSVWQEACPYSVLEAMAAGRAVVATAVGGIPEMITDGRNGRLVPPADPAALAEAMGQILRLPDRGRSLGEAARQTIGTVFTPEQQYRRMIEIIESALALPDRCY